MLVGEVLEDRWELLEEVLASMKWSRLYGTFVSTILYRRSHSGIFEGEQFFWGAGYS